MEPVNLMGVSRSSSKYVGHELDEYEIHLIYTYKSFNLLGGLNINKEVS